MYYFFVLLSSILVFFIKASGGEFIEDDKILQIEKYPEIINGIVDDKIYLKAELLNISNEGIVLNSFSGPIMLSNINADADGFYIKLKRWHDYYFCMRCNCLFEKDFILACPTCSRDDKLVFRYSEYK